MRGLRLSLLVAAFVLAAWLPQAASAATWNVTWDKQGKVKRIASINNVAPTNKQGATWHQFARVFGRAEKSSGYGAGTMCRVVWRKKAGMFIDFERNRYLRKNCVKKKAHFSGMSIVGDKRTNWLETGNWRNWRLAGRELPLCKTLDQFRLLFPEAKLLEAKGSYYPQDDYDPASPYYDEDGRPTMPQMSEYETWAIAKPYRTHHQRAPQSDVFVGFERVWETSPKRIECPFTPVHSLVAEYVRVEKRFISRYG